MAFNSGISHVLLLKGNLETNKGKLSIQLVNEDVKHNLWQISLQELIVCFKEPVNIVCGLSTNFVKDIVADEPTKLIKNYFPILKQTVLKGSAQEKKFFRFETSWHYISNIEDNLVVYFHDLENSKSLKKKCDVWLTLILQRVS